MLKAIFSSAIGDGALKALASDARPQADKHLGMRSSADRIPHFRFSAAASSLLVPRGVFIVRMDLHGKLVFREDEFNQERKGRTTAQISSRPFDGHGGPDIAEFLS